MELLFIEKPKNVSFHSMQIQYPRGFQIRHAGDDTLLVTYF